LQVLATASLALDPEKSPATSTDSFSWRYGKYRFSIDVDAEVNSAHLMPDALPDASCT
jgi:hypothetical protein